MRERSGCFDDAPIPLFGFVALMPNARAMMLAPLPWGQRGPVIADAEAFASARDAV